MPVSFSRATLAVVTSLFVLSCQVWATVSDRYTPPQSAREESDQTLDRVQNLAQRLLRVGEGKHSVYVAIGVSPVIVAAAIEAELGADRVVHIPLSSLQQVVEDDYSDRRAPGFFNRYLDHFFAPRFAGGDTRFVIMDFANTGESLHAMHRLLEAYLQSKGLVGRLKFEVAGFGESWRWRFPPGMTEYLALSDGLYDQFYSHHFDYVRLYRRYSVHQFLAWAEHNPEIPIATKLQEMRDEGGRLRYREAVELFRERSSRGKAGLHLMDRCRALLLGLRS